VPVTDPGPRLREVRALGFLLGRWEGVGEWKGEPVRLHTSGSPAPGGLRLDVLVTQAEAPVHAEEVLFSDTVRGVDALTCPEPGREQHWTVHEIEPETAFVLSHGDAADTQALRLRWTIRRSGRDVIDETLEVARPGAAGFALDLTARHQRTSEAPGG
jgi:hypothetical protein